MSADAFRCSNSHNLVANLEMFVRVLDSIRMFACSTVSPSIFPHKILPVIIPRPDPSRTRMGGVAHVNTHATRPPPPPPTIFLLSSSQPLPLLLLDLAIMKPKVEELGDDDSAVAAMDQLAEAAKLVEAGGAYDAQLINRLPAAPVAETPLLHSIFNFKEALSVALDATGAQAVPLSRVHPIELVIDPHEFCF